MNNIKQTNKPFGEPIKCVRENCDIIFQRTTKKKTKKYCCKECVRLNMIGKPSLLIGYKHSEETKSKLSISHMGQIAWNKGLPKEMQPGFGKKSALGYRHSEEAKAKMSVARKGIKLGKRIKPMSEETKIKRKIALILKPKRVLSEEHKNKLIQCNKDRIWTDEMKKRCSGSNSHLWKGGISSEQNILRNSAEYKNWRKSVYKRDNYSCVVCGINKKLHAHHVKEFSKYKELRYDINNGITVCQKCHSDIHGRYIPDIGSNNKKTNNKLKCQ